MKTRVTLRYFGNDCRRNLWFLRFLLLRLKVPDTDNELIGTIRTFDCDKLLLLESPQSARGGIKFVITEKKEKKLVRHNFFSGSLYL